MWGAARKNPILICLKEEIDRRLMVTRSGVHSRATYQKNAAKAPIPNGSEMRKSSIVLIGSDQR